MRESAQTDLKRRRSIKMSLSEKPNALMLFAELNVVPIGVIRLLRWRIASRVIDPAGDARRFVRTFLAIKESGWGRGLVLPITREPIKASWLAESSFRHLPRVSA